MKKFERFHLSYQAALLILSLGLSVIGCEEKPAKNTLGFQNEDASLLIAGAIFFSTFHSNGDGTITNSTTGLTWKVCSQGQTYVNTSGGYSCEGGGISNSGFGAAQYQYCNQNSSACNTVSTPQTLTNVSQIGVGGSSEAFNNCSSDRTAGKTDWRVATYGELKALGSSGRNEMLLKFPDTIEDYYWSSWANEQDSSGQTARAVSFAQNQFGTDFMASKTSRYYIRCVRP